MGVKKLWKEKKRWMKEHMWISMSRYLYCLNLNCLDLGINVVISQPCCPNPGRFLGAILLGFSFAAFFIAIEIRGILNIKLFWKRYPIVQPNTELLTECRWSHCTRSITNNRHPLLLLQHPIGNPNKTWKSLSLDFFVFCFTEIKLDQALLTP